MLESALIRGVALDVEEAKVTLDEVPDRPGIAASIFKAVAAEGIHVDMIVQNISHDGRTDLSFTIPVPTCPRERRAREHRGRRRRPAFETDDAIAKLSLVGAGIKRLGVAADMFDALGRRGHQHRDDLDVVDPHLLCDPGRGRGTRGSRGAQALRARRRDAGRGGLSRGRPTCREVNEEGRALCVKCGSSLEPSTVALLPRREHGERPPIEIRKPPQPSKWRPLVMLGVIVGVGVVVEPSSSSAPIPAGEPTSSRRTSATASSCPRAGRPDPRSSGPT